MFKTSTTERQCNCNVLPESFIVPVPKRLFQNIFCLDVSGPVSEPVSGSGNTDQIYIVVQHVVIECSGMPLWRAWVYLGQIVVQNVVIECNGMPLPWGCAYLRQLINILYSVLTWEGPPSLQPSDCIKAIQIQLYLYWLKSMNNMVDPMIAVNSIATPVS